MDLREIATINFRDVDSGEEAVAIIRAAEGRIAFCLSLLQNGDIEVVMEPHHCNTIFEALQKAFIIALSPTTEG